MEVAGSMPLWRCIFNSIRGLKSEETRIDAKLTSTDAPCRSPGLDTQICFKCGESRRLGVSCLET
jgi:hypothetical protein